MANEEHLRILRSGVAEWNRWRRTNSVAPDLGEAILTGAKLRDVDLMWVTLRGANLVRADLRSANLHNANLCGADVSRADLSQANLTGAIFGGTKLRKAKVTGATLWGCVFANVSLFGIVGLEKTKHFGPSHISISTLEHTSVRLGKHSSIEQRREIEVFLEGAGVPSEYIEFFRTRIGQPIQFYSAFISYSTKDQDFADRLYADLRRKDIRCWLATEDLKIGDKFRTRINDAISIHDKLMIVLSEHSVKSVWVEEEVEAAFERERRDGTTVLFPIRLDDVVMDSDEAWAASIRRTRHIGDFRRWKDHEQYQKALARLIRDLQADDKTKPASI